MTPRPRAIRRQGHWGTSSLRVWSRRAKYDAEPGRCSVPGGFQNSDPTQRVESTRARSLMRRFRFLRDAFHVGELSGALRWMDYLENPLHRAQHPRAKVAADATAMRRFMGPSCLPSAAGVGCAPTPKVGPRAVNADPVAPRACDSRSESHAIEATGVAQPPRSRLPEPPNPGGFTMRGPTIETRAYDAFGGAGVWRRLWR